MAAGPHLSSVSAMRKVLEDIPDAIRYEDPLAERAGSGDNPATEVWVSDPDRDQYQLAPDVSTQASIKRRIPTRGLRRTRRDFRSAARDNGCRYP